MPCFSNCQFYFVCYQTGLFIMVTGVEIKDTKDIVYK